MKYFFNSVILRAGCYKVCDLTVEDLRRKVLSKNVFLLSCLPCICIYIYIYIYIYIIYNIICNNIYYIKYIIDIMCVIYKIICYI